MLDVIHVFFEEDILPTWEGGTEVKDQARNSIYRDLYGQQYKYGFTSQQGRSADWDSPSIYEDPADGAIKPYIPPTDPEDLANLLGPPVG